MRSLRALTLLWVVVAASILMAVGCSSQPQNPQGQQVPAQTPNLAATTAPGSPGMPGTPVAAGTGGPAAGGGLIGPDGKPLPGMDKWAGKKDPEPNNADTLVRAKTIFITNCAPCHGEDGKGTGPLAATIPPDQPKPRDFTTGEFKYGSEDGHIMRTIMEGVPATMMAGWDGRLPEKDAWDLVYFVRSLKK